MDPTKATAAAILAAGAMIAAAVYFKPLPGRYVATDGTHFRLDTTTGALDRCGETRTKNDKRAITCAPFEEW